MSVQNFTTLDGRSLFEAVEPIAESGAVPSPPRARRDALDLPAASLARVLDLARLALRVDDAAVVEASPDGTSLDASAAKLDATIMPEGAVLGRLVVRAAPDRIWSDEDRAILDGLAETLAIEIGLRTGVHSSANAAPKPVATAAFAPGVLVRKDELSGSDALRILLADDLDLNRKLICDMLSLDGYEVDSVPDGAAAVEAARSKPYDLILMDMIMPGMDGVEATRAIRALPSPAGETPIVALTAHSFREQLDDCLHAGMNATLTKPMSFEALSSAVTSWARPRKQAA